MDFFLSIQVEQQAKIRIFYTTAEPCKCGLLWPYGDNGDIVTTANLSCPGLAYQLNVNFTWLDRSSIQYQIYLVWPYNL